MLHAASDLMRYKALIEGQEHQITDLFLSPNLSTLTHITARKPLISGSGQRAVNAKHAGAPDTEQRAIALSTTERSFEEGPLVKLNSRLESVAEMVSSRGALNEHVISRGEKIEDKYERASDWIGQAVLAGNDEVGKVDDFLIEWPRFAVNYFVINTGTTLPERQVVLPVECCEVIRGDNPGLRLNVDREALATAPEIESIDKVDRHWLDTLRAYYKLPI